MPRRPTFVPDGHEPSAASDAERVRDAGWLHDPTRRHQIRYWNGQRWTERVSDNGRRTTDELAAAGGIGFASFTY